MSATRPLRAYAEVSLGRQRSPGHDTGPFMVPYLRAANVLDGRLDLRDVKQMNFTPAEQIRFSLRPGDVLITEGSGSLGSVGASAVWNGQLSGPVCFQNTLLRLRPRVGVDGGYLLWWARHAFAEGVFASVATGANIFHLSAERVRALPVTDVPLTTQVALARYLAAETGRVDAVIEKKYELLAALDERIDAEILEIVGRSELAGSEGDVAPIQRLLGRARRSPSGSSEVVTAFRDGQVTARSLRRAEGYTETWMNHSGFQGVLEGDVVVHGLDGFAGAIGTSESAGICSPVYHVCTPADGGDAQFYGRLLRLLAVTGYLGLFASSTRERAVDFRNWDLFGRIPIPRVSVATQRDIGDRIRHLAPLKRQIARSVSLAVEHRQALITGTVTGELEIPGVA